jgi:hypothetical protein
LRWHGSVNNNFAFFFARASMSTDCAAAGERKLKKRDQQWRQ